MASGCAICGQRIEYVRPTSVWDLDAQAVEAVQHYEGLCVTHARVTIAGECRVVWDETSEGRRMLRLNDAAVSTAPLVTDRILEQVEQTQRQAR